MSTIVLCATTTASACKVPVFRYGLEHWEPDPYQAVILHRGKLADDAQTLTTKLEAIQADIDNVVNLEVTRINVDEVEKADDELLSEVLGADYREEVSEPEIILLYPRESYSGPLAWRGKLSAENIDAILDSPARRKIAKMILAGESAVWVLIGVGDEEKDEAAEKILRKELAYLEENLEMRDVEVIQSDSKFGEDTTVELRLGLKLIVLDARDPKERVFARLLMRSEEDLEDLGEPVAIPIFGRGRAYLSLAGKGINPELIAEICEFLVGDCGCEVKRQNPGVDLLFAVDWSEETIGTADVQQPLPELAGIGSYDEAVEVSADETPPSDQGGKTDDALPSDDGMASNDADATGMSDATELAHAQAAIVPKREEPSAVNTISDEHVAASAFNKQLTIWIVSLIAVGVAMAAIMTFRLRSQSHR